MFGYNFIFTNSISLDEKLSPNIYLDSQDLNSTVLGFSSITDISGYEIHSNCDTTSQFLEQYKSVYYFRLSFLADCSNPNIILKNGEDIYLTTTTKLNFVDKGDIFNILTDYSTPDLNAYKEALERTIVSTGLYKNYDGTQIGKNYSFLQKQRKHYESLYKKEIVDFILERRKLPYISPVPGKALPETNHSKLPNTGRPYRANYTDGIHHGWDIDGNIGEKVAALDDGLIVRIVDIFDFSDLQRIKYGSLTEDDKLKNLDLLRGKQVWLKTAKGEIIFYSHLDEVFDYIDEGDMVVAGTPLGTIGNSGVPEKDYDDYHLHFEIQVNPYNKDTAGTYSFDDYLRWDWKLKGKTRAEILEAQKLIFSY